MGWVGLTAWADEKVKENGKDNDKFRHIMWTHWTSEMYRGYRALGAKSGNLSRDSCYTTEHRYLRVRSLFAISDFCRVLAYQYISHCRNIAMSNQ